jgi:TIR domain
VYNLNRSNQEQMLLIDEELRGRGLTTCVDRSNHPSPYILEMKTKIYQNINDSDSILIFVTSKFMGKVNGMDGNNDICKLEYDYALKTASGKMIVVILEERMRNISQWKGALRFVRAF